MEKNGEIKQKGHLYQMGHNPFRSFYAGIPCTQAVTLKGYGCGSALILMQIWIQHFHFGRKIHKIVCDSFQSFVNPKKIKQYGKRKS
jgi:hypothetical protein